MASSVNAIPLDVRRAGRRMSSRWPPIPVESSRTRGSGPPWRCSISACSPHPAAGVDEDRRIEDWIASHLDLALADRAGPRIREPSGISSSTGSPCSGGPRAAGPLRGGAETAFADWSRFRIAYRRGITVVRLIDLALVKERDVRELTRDLIELIEAGNHRLLLNFHGIERVASWVALAVDEAFRRSKAADGGELKICGLSDSLAAVLEIAGMAPGIERFPDESAALDAPWPEPSTPAHPARSTSCSP